MIRSLGVLAVAATIAAQAAFAAPRVGEIESLVGKGEYLQARQSSWRPAQVKQSLFPEDVVRTLDLSRMAVLFGDGTRLQLSPNSHLQVTQSVTAAKPTLNINQGRAWGNSPGGPQTPNIRTPAVNAGIRGTEWLIEVEESGATTVSVFAGEIEMSNEQGSVSIGANEQGRAERGKAPVKLTLRISRERVQWVSSFTVDARRYGPAPEIEALVDDGRLAEAYAKAKQLTPDSSPAAWLLLSDFEVYRGELAAAKDVLLRGSARHPGDERFDVALARIALFEDRAADARGHAQAAVRKRPDSVEALVMLGDVERNQGYADAALAAYTQATRAAANDARGWHGLGVVESERENVRRSRALFEKAIALEPREASHRSELGTLEGFAGNLAAARNHLAKALELRPYDYVAWTGLGIVELKAGNVPAAVEALSRANALEPRYARTYVYLAAAYYQIGNERHALEALDRAAELDPNDPLPHMLTAIVYLDRIEPGRAAEASQRALARMPFLKSANQVADNQRGIANAAYPLAYMGLEAWSRSAAQESYLPYWGGSHLFLADRYPGSFNRRSELMLGFLTDPLVFGASNRYQSLFITPGHHGTLSMGFNTSEQLRVLDPVVTLNGHSAGPLPMSYFVEASDARVDPRDLPFEARQRSFTVAVGAKPTHELGVFVYAAYVNSDFEVGQELSTRQFERVSAESARVDAGIRYAPDARSSYWAKAGGGTTKRSTDFAFNFVIPGLSLVQNVSQEPKRDEADVALRHTRDIGKALQLTLGAEAAWLRNPLRLVADTVVHVPGQGVNQERDLFGVRDKTQSLYGSARARFGPLQAEAGMTYAEYHADRDLLVSRDAFPGQDIYLTGTFRRRKGDPMAGLAWHASEHVIARAMCRRWVRPLSIDTLAPLAVAGIAIEDQLVLRGGELEQCRLHGEVRLGSRAFAFAFADHVKVRNIVSGVQGISNVGEEATNVERLRNRVLSPPLRPDQLEDEPVFGSGTARRAGIALEALVTQNLGARLHYTYIDSHNDDPTASYLRLPYMPRHQVHVGATWTPGWRTVVTAQAVYRTRRFTDENNTVSLPASWDAYVRLFWESPRKRWGLELTAANLIKKETPDLFGIVVSYRF